MNDLEKSVLGIIGEDIDDPDVFTDDDAGMAQIRASLNDAIEEISLLTGGFRTPYYLTIISGQGFYRLAPIRDRIAWIVGAWLHGQTRRLERTDVTKLAMNNPRWMLNTGSPQSYLQIGWSVLGLWPRPAASGDILELDCVIIPRRYAVDTDKVNLQDEFRWAAIHYAVSEFWASRGDAKSATDHFTKYANVVGLAPIYQTGADRHWQMKTEKNSGDRPSGS